MTSIPQDTDLVAQLVGGRIINDLRNVLNGDFTKEEAFEALNQMHPLKAPSLDGTPVVFYHKF